MEAKMSTVQNRIDELVKNNKVVLFMKGNPQMPQCGFSARATTILAHLGVAEFAHVDVLSDPEIRQGIKEYSNWPTIPPLYINGEFLGGSDIMMEQYQNGELAAQLQA
jgi:monothiol glutaredoxin